MRGNDSTSCSRDFREARGLEEGKGREGIVATNSSEHL